MPDSELPVNTIPAWAATIIASVAEIKTRTERLPVIEKELDGLRDRQVPLTEHMSLQARTNTLWDAYQRTKGVLWVMGVVQALLAAGFAGHFVHVLP